MAEIVVMPRQGNSVESCVILEWKKREGDTVSAEDILCEVETDKAAFEIPAGFGGTLLKILHSAGEDVPVLKPIAVIGKPGENLETLLRELKDPGGTQEKGREIEKELAPSLPEAGKDIPQVEEVAENRIEPAIPAGEPEIVASAKEGGPYASPRARRRAREEKVLFEGLKGSGPEGRVLERDLVEALEERMRILKSPGQTESPDRTGREPLAEGAPSDRALSGGSGSVKPESFPGPYEDEEMTKIRGIIAERMFQSLSTTAQYTLNSRADVEILVSLNKRLKERRGREEGFKDLPDLSINDLILFAVSRILPDFPDLNSHRNGKTLRRFSRVHLGVAVDTPRGLMVPVIRNADLLSLGEIAREKNRLSSACRQGRILPEDLKGSTFTVSSLGSLGVESFTPVLNIPEVAILGVCSITAQPVIGETGEVEFRRFLGLSLTLDHQAVDGAPAARFLKALTSGIRDIDILLSTKTTPY